MCRARPTIKTSVSFCLTGLFLQSFQFRLGTAAVVFYRLDNFPIAQPTAAKQ